MTVMDACKLKFEGMCKDYPSGRVVDNVSLDVRAGEIHALVGENGAGKSTVIKMAAGVVQAEAGTISIDGKPVVFANAKEAREAGVSVVYQELTLVPIFDAAENIFLGRPYPRTKLGLTDTRSLRRATARILETLGTDVPLNVPVMYLSPAMQAMVAIARAVALESAILILDEPTASLSAIETDHLFEVLQRLKERGTAILYVSHRLEEIVRIADRITVMRDGRLVQTMPAEGVTIDAIIELMIGRSLAQMFPDRKPEMGQPLLEVTGLSGPGVRDISFVLHRGEVLGVGGLGGSGRTELLKLLAGASHRRAGTVLLDGRPYHPRTPHEAVADGVVLVPEERRSEGLCLTLSVSENLMLGNLPSIAWKSMAIRPSLEKQRAGALVKRLAIKTAGFGQRVSELSGGNQQKVVFGKCLAGEVTVLLLDEPTRGVDVGSKAEIYEIVRKAADEGRGVMLVSSDLPELLGISDKVLLLADNREAMVMPAGELDERMFLNFCCGGTGA